MEAFLSFLNSAHILEGITIVASSHNMSKEGRDFFSLENIFCLPLYSQGKDYPRSQFVACSAVQAGWSLVTYWGICFLKQKAFSLNKLWHDFHPADKTKQRTFPVVCRSEFGGFCLHTELLEAMNQIADI